MTCSVGSGAAPRVTAASLLYRGPAQGTWGGAPPLPPGQEPPITIGTTASADYDRVMGLRVVRGRWFTDTEAERVIVINESLARRDFRGEDPLGRRLKSVGPVVGVVADLKFSKLDASPEPEFFTPYADAKPGDHHPARRLACRSRLVGRSPHFLLPPHTSLSQPILTWITSESGCSTACG